MTKALDIASWRAATVDEVMDFYKGKSKRRDGSLIVRSKLRPVDVYAYLCARFGSPNGLLDRLRKDDSDNWIHWDFNLKVEAVDIHIAGTSRDVHIAIGEKVTDDAWKALITKVKQDFRRVGSAKSEIVRSFEKFVVFQNKYLTLALVCAEMHDAITQAPEGHIKLPQITSRRSLTKWKAETTRLMKQATDLYGDCLKLRMLTPIMAEAFINMVILVFCKDEVRNDPERYDSFVRSKLPERLAALSEYCWGFTRPIDQTTAVYGNFKRVMDKRNFAIHGNIDPVREQIETVYFEGKRPLFAEGGDNIGKHFEHLDAINAPKIVVADYEAVHLFLVEITEYLADGYRDFFEHVINDPYPGYEVKKKRVTKILPDYNMKNVFPGSRYDDDLSW